MTDKIETLLNKAAEAAKSLCISERKLWELRNLQEIPCVRIGRRLRFVPADMHVWIEHQKGFTQRSDRHFEAGADETSC